MLFFASFDHIGRRGGRAKSRAQTLNRGILKITKQEMIHAFDSMRVSNPCLVIQFSDLDDETYVDGTAIPL